MKIPRLDDILTFRGRLFKVIGLIDDPTVMIKPLYPDHCPHCDGILERTPEVHVISSPNFQNGAAPVPTIVDTT